MLAGKRILLVISGGIAAYKALELIRRLKDRGVAVRAILTRGGAEFITPLSVAALSGEKVFTDLFSLTDESEMGHIRLSREADLVVVAPASADLIAKMAAGLADDLATTALLATDKPVMIAPAMNTMMWQNAATLANIETLARRGILRVGPAAGDLACGEVGEGRMAEPAEILDAIENYFRTGARLAGRVALVTSGPTYEAIDPVRFLGNRSSGRQGHAIAAALAALGADVHLVSGPASEPDPPGVRITHVESAREMLEACLAALPVEVAVCAAAVADWRPAETAPSKLKKTGGAPPKLSLIANPDILRTLADAGNRRPRLLIGFAAETRDLIQNAIEKRKKKGCDWILANDVAPGTGTFGGTENRVHLVSEAGVEDWEPASKRAIADRLAQRIADHLQPAA
jgi:phosphopantothenoylcysteine decarboxylase / phosphopantothenate---cysteine ligase